MAAGRSAVGRWCALVALVAVAFWAAAWVPTPATAVRAAGECSTSDCGANHNQVLV